MNEVRVVHLTPFRPTADGHGGNRRSYQVHRDLVDAMGEGCVATIDNPLDFVPPAQLRGWRRQLARGRRVVRTLRANPLKPLRPTPFTPFLFSTPALLARYEDVVRSATPPLVCVMEHPGFSAVAAVNRRYGVRTVGCPQNLESLDTFLPRLDDSLGLKAKSLDLASELAVAAGWDERLFISRVEAGVVSGLGLTSTFYPYLPAGEARERLLAVRAARRKAAREPGLFLMLGTSGHETTRRALSWWLDAARRQPLPAGVRVIVGGLRTGDLAREGPVPERVELRDWIASHELDALLARVCGFLVPQTLGFGAVTRLADLACAGVPVIASEQALWAVSVPPGVRGVPNDWPAWTGEMSRLANETVPAAGYEEWEALQARPLGEAVARLVGGPAAA